MRRKRRVHTRRANRKTAEKLLGPNIFTSGDGLNRREKRTMISGKKAPITQAITETIIDETMIAELEWMEKNPEKEFPFEKILEETARMVIKELTKPNLTYVKPKGTDT